MNWVQINERLFELEKREKSSKEMEEWNKLLSLNVAGIIKRKKISEEDIRKAKKEERGEKTT
mgnify:FL=1|jgi:hypothetical protein